jgi:tripeptide aminopeptidase
MNPLPSPSRERLTQIFVSLARIPSPSRSERAVGDAVISYLEQAGITVHEDGTGQVISGDCGNLWCTVTGASPEPCLALGAHLDTVASGSTCEPALGGDGIFRCVGGGILGADDKAAVAALVHAVELLREWDEPVPTFELFFTVCEEQGLVGAKHLGSDVVRSPMAVVFDSTGPVGGVVTRAPSQRIIRAAFRGTAAHAGVEPELGRSAIVAAARAIAAMPLSRLDVETTANIGVIRGGVATNIVPELCEIEGECRGHNEERLAQVAAAMVDAIQEGAATVGVDVEISLIREFEAFALAEDSPVVRLSRAALAALGLLPTLKTAGGGSDANVLNAHGVPTVNLDAGMMRVHSSEEYLPLDDLERLCALIVRMIIMAPEFSRGGQGDERD